MMLLQTMLRMKKEKTVFTLMSHKITTENGTILLATAQTNA